MKPKTNRFCKSPLFGYYYILAAYGVGIFFFTLFRIITLIVFYSDPAYPHEYGINLAKAFLMGLRFDTVISCYLLSLPILLIICGTIAKITKPTYYKAIHIFTTTIYIISFFTCAADIPYFKYFFTRLNASALTWMDSFSFVFKMIAEEPIFICYLLAFIVIATTYIFIMKLLRRYFLQNPLFETNRTALRIIFGVVFIGLCLLGARGRITIKSPIRVGTAYFSNNAFLNQLGLNPLFTFLNSVAESGKYKEINLIDNDTAEMIVTEQMENSEQQNPNIIRLRPDTNVVVVIMESMAAFKVGHFGEGQSLTPQLDNIIAQSLSFENAYSAGIHTYNGIYSTLFSHPALLNQHSMKKTVIPYMCGLPNNLRRIGYSTMYFTTHDDQFDNVAGFLYANDIERIISQKDYPMKEIKSTLGVPDHIMFERAIQELDNIDSSKPFFACLMTASDHNPYILPDDIPFKPKSTEISKKIIEYADWAIGNFVENAKKSQWYENTLFIFVADHGASGSSIYNMSLQYHHIPMIFYAPSQIKPQENRQIALQIDLGPTVLGMLFPDIKANNLGIDLQRQKREYAYFCSDENIGVLDGTYFLIHRISDGDEGLYQYKENDTFNYVERETTRTENMRKYAFSMIQYSFNMLKDRNTSCDKSILQ